MATITVTFNHPGGGADGEDFARVSASGFPGEMFLGPGKSGDFTDADEPSYELFVKVGTRAGVDWTVTVETSTGFNKSRPGTGPDSFLVSVPVGAALGGPLGQTMSLARR